MTRWLLAVAAIAIAAALVWLAFHSGPRARREPTADPSPARGDPSPPPRRAKPVRPPRAPDAGIGHNAVAPSIPEAAPAPATPGARGTVHYPPDSARPPR